MATGNVFLAGLKVAADCSKPFKINALYAGPASKSLCLDTSTCGSDIKLGFK